jgi:hypothetical protein
MRTVLGCFVVVVALTVPRLGGAATISSSSFLSCAPGHAGTAADPWPGCAIQAAIASAGVGDTVLVGNGYWAFRSNNSNTASGFTLQGESLAATVQFLGANWTLGSQSAPTSNVTIRGLTFDGSQSTAAPAIYMENCVNCTFTGNTVIGSSNGNLAALFFEGGANNKITNNTIRSAPGPAGGDTGGGAQLQINALGGTPNSGFEVSGNTFDSVNILIIGMNHIRIHGNTMGNSVLQNSFAIFIAPAWNGIATGVEIDHNILDGGGVNEAYITGLPQDPGGQGSIIGFIIDGNVVKGTEAKIAVNTFSTSCLSSCTSISDTYDAIVTNNIIESAWGPAVISLDGGTYGVVRNVTVQGNILVGPTTGQNIISTDTHTFNANVVNNIK